MKKILIADDDRAICDSLQFMLTEEGYEVGITYSGSTIAKINAFNPDLLLLDLWMSGEDGRDICRTIKKNIQTKHLPVILISANRDIRSSAKDSGANDFIAKPFEMDDLLAKVSMWINN